MKINASDLVSRQTQIAAKTLTIISALVIFVDYYKLEPLNWPLLKGDLEYEAYRAAAASVVLFSSVSLSINWWGDYVAYKKWFKSNEVSQGTLWGMSGPKSTEPPVAGVKRRLEWLAQKHEGLDELIEKIQEIDDLQTRRKDADVRNKELYEQVKLLLEQSSGTIESLKEEVRGLSELLDELPRNFRDIDRITKFTIFGWFLGIPLLLGLCAFGLVFCGS